MSKLPDQRTVDDWVSELHDGVVRFEDLDDPLLDDLTECLRARQNPVDISGAVDLVAASIKALRTQPRRDAAPTFVDGCEPGSRTYSTVIWLASHISSDPERIVEKAALRKPE